MVREGFKLNGTRGAKAVTCAMGVALLLGAFAPVAAADHPKVDPLEARCEGNQSGGYLYGDVVLRRANPGDANNAFYYLSGAKAFSEAGGTASLIIQQGQKNAAGYNYVTGGGVEETGLESGTFYTYSPEDTGHATFAITKHPGYQTNEERVAIFTFQFSNGDACRYAAEQPG